MVSKSALRRGKTNFLDFFQKKVWKSQEFSGMGCLKGTKTRALKGDLTISFMLEISI